MFRPINMFITFHTTQPRQETYDIFIHACRSIEYKINEHHRFHVVAKAEVVPVALELSCDTIILKPTSSMAAESGKKIFIISKILFVIE